VSARLKRPSTSPQDTSGSPLRATRAGCSVKIAESVRREASAVTPAAIRGHVGDLVIDGGVDAITKTGTVSACHAAGPAEHAAARPLRSPG
jgi:hypothetical protein